MYITDLLGAHPEPQLENTDEDLEEAPDPHAAFYEHIPYSPSRLSYERPANPYKGLCVFDESGNHIYMGKYCQCFEPEDQEGRRIVPGWTVQQSRR